MPLPGYYRERLNTDAAVYGGSQHRQWRRHRWPRTSPRTAGRTRCRLHPAAAWRTVILEHQPQLSSSRHGRGADDRLAGPAAPARRDLGRQRGQLRAVLGACRPGSSCACSTARDGARSSASRCRNTPTRSGTAICRRRTPACSTATASTAPTSPTAGHRFNPNKLLLDPYAKALRGQLRWSDAHFGYRLGSGARGPLVRPARQRPRHAQMRAWSTSAYTWGDDQPPGVPWGETITYETHVRGMTMRHPGVPERAARHLRRARPPGGDRPPAQARRHRGRAAAGPGLRPGPASARPGSGQLLGLQLDRLLRARAALSGGRRDRRVQDHGQALPRRRHRGDPGRRLQPHRRGQPPRPDAVVPRHRQRDLLPSQAGRSALLRRRHRHAATPST